MPAAIQSACRAPSGDVSLGSFRGPWWVSCLRTPPGEARDGACVALVTAFATGPAARGCRARDSRGTRERGADGRARLPLAVAKVEEQIAAKLAAAANRTRPLPEKQKRAARGYRVLSVVRSERREELLGTPRPFVSGSRCPAWGMGINRTFGRPRSRRSSTASTSTLCPRRRATRRPAADHRQSRGLLRPPPGGPPRRCCRRTRRARARMEVSSLGRTSSEAPLSCRDRQRSCRPRLGVAGEALASPYRALRERPGNATGLARDPSRCSDQARLSGHTKRVPVSTSELAAATTASAFVSWLVMP
jgi:hypothetical protein